MKNIQLERQYLHKNTFKIHQLSKRQVESQYNTNFFSLLAPPKGDWCVSTFYARMRTKTSARKENI